MLHILHTYLLSSAAPGLIISEDSSSSSSSSIIPSIPVALPCMVESEWLLLLVLFAAVCVLLEESPGGEEGEEGEEESGGEMGILELQYSLLELRLSRMCWASGCTSSAHVSNSGYTMRSMKVTWGSSGSCSHVSLYVHVQVHTSVAV